MPSLRQLEYLVAIADTLSFRRAAERSHTTQPTLSEQLKALESRLGVQLVERSKTSVVITPLGQQVVEIARRVIGDVREIQSLSASGGRELSGLLRLGLPPTIGPYLLQHAVPALHRAHPSLKLYVREDVPQSLPRALEEGQHDIVITSLPLTGREIETTELFREPLYLTVAADHRLAKKPSARLSDIKGEDVLALGPSHQLHNAVLAISEEAGARLRFDFEGTSLDMLREMLVMGLGVTFMPGLYARSELFRDPNVRVLEITDRNIFRTIGMAWRKTSNRQKSYLKLAEFFRSAAQRSLRSAK